MKCWQGCLILSFLVLGTNGCKTSGSTEALQRELRYQEDMIYQLQDYIRTYKCYLEECRQENETCQQNGKAPSQNTSILEQKAHPDVHLTPPGILRSDDHVRPPAIELPGIHKGAEARFPQQPFGKLQQENMYASQPITTQWAYPLPDNITLARYQESILKDPRVPTPLGVGERIDDPVIVGLPFNKGLAGGYTERGTSGGIWLLLAPQNVTGQKVRPRGELSIALINPRAYSDDNARVANWKFSSAQVKLITDDLPVGESLLLELPWSGEPPLDNLLQVYIRLITPEGNQLLVDQRIDLSQQEPFLNRDQSGQGWRKRTRPRDFTIVDNFVVPQGRRQTLPKASFTKQRLQPATIQPKPLPVRAARSTEWKPYR
jgi:hypothetical protein